VKSADLPLENIFQAHGPLSFARRPRTTGFSMFKLVTTARSFDEMMLHICRIVNEEPKVHAIEGAFDKEASKFAEDLNFRLHGIRRTAVFLNVQGSITSITAFKSAHNVQMAIVATDCIVR
jgi:hypothetical protein